jgi:sugar phosphate isomerase/epimerase
LTSVFDRHDHVADAGNLKRGAVTPDFSLAHLTVESLAPPEVVAVASRAGYRYVGLRIMGAMPQGAVYPLMSDKAMMRETKARLAATGLQALDIEFFRLQPETEVASFLPALEAGAELGARHVIAAAYDPDRSRLIERFSALCDLAAACGLGVVLEFFPWTDAPNLSDAAAVVAAAGRTNAGVLVDTLHFARSDSTLAQLRQMPAAQLPFMHLCDAPAEKPDTVEGMIFTARVERLLPGDGAIDIAAIMRRMPPNIPVALEVPMGALTRAIGPAEVARRAREAAARVLAPVVSER